VSAVTDELGLAVAARDNPARRTSATGARAVRRTLGRLAGRAVREPFFHFLVLGGALFLLNHHLEERSRYVRVTVTKAQVAGIADNYRQQYGVAPTATQLDSLVNHYIREEVYYHEAMKLGLDKGDEIIRRRLVQKYEFLQQDLALADEPAEAQLQSWYGAHAQNYVAPPRVGFTQVFFSFDRRGDAPAHAAALAALQSLHAAGSTRATQRGDRFPGPADYAGLARNDAERVFGREGLAQELFAAPAGQWSGPYRSAYGWHLVYVNDVQAPGREPFADVRDAVRRDFIEADRQAKNDAALANLERGFEIVRE
jgi:hypothetical protein